MGECETRLLSDAPANIDAFRSHGGIAQALAALIESEEGGVPPPASYMGDVFAGRHVKAEKVAVLGS
jgi:hypothetical protein